MVWRSKRLEIFPNQASLVRLSACSVFFLKTSNSPTCPPSPGHVSTHQEVVKARGRGLRPCPGPGADRSFSGVPGSGYAVSSSGAGFSDFSSRAACAATSLATGIRKALQLT